MLPGRPQPRHLGGGGGRRRRARQGPGRRDGGPQVVQRRLVAAPEPGREQPPPRLGPGRRRSDARGHEAPALPRVPPPAAGAPQPTGGPADHGDAAGGRGRQRHVHEPGRAPRAPANGGHQQRRRRDGPARAQGPPGGVLPPVAGRGQPKQDEGVGRQDSPSVRRPGVLVPDPAPRALVPSGSRPDHRRRGRRRVLGPMQRCHPAHVRRKGVHGDR
mmetsp:Transcript_63881/g.166101  ORF Transcript_63881/g.166101 Transcript_63881/m.166101 type:complete len:216 (+) Transcript_63881:937-1584(+)